ncbi:MAG: AAC(3) family N-acetyltransferase [Nitrospirae bacterium]|nr:AAC(3) family N-acetyltransferase [Nitrospirota bacterium]MBF0536443.1 AAC(3) family N-acetyltransferase [Nitrospirota bacterium]MBF0618346.1 AAC(3) family N-acetyltransferase [Nitrospirota bacterium]
MRAPLKNIIRERLKEIALKRLNARNPKELLRYPLVRFQKAFYPKFSLTDLMDALRVLGLKKNMTVFIHSSWNSFFNFTSSPVELLEALIEEISPDGTLMMPAYPQQDVDYFDVLTTPSYAGLLTELFRRYPGVKRSVNIDHSVCALGPNADYLLNDHHRSETSWDEFSPYYRIGNIGNAVIMGLGVGKNLEICTSLHCVESILRKEIYYYSLIFPTTVTYTYRDTDGNEGTHTFLKRTGNMDTKKLAIHMDKTYFRETKLSNLDIYSIDAGYVIKRAIELGRAGITQYTYPVPDKKLFYKI